MKLSIIVYSMLSSLALIPASFAQDVNQMGDGIAMLIPFIVFIVVIVSIIFWIKMLFDVIAEQHTNKALWIVVVLFGNTIGAIIYYFAAKKPRLEAGGNLQSQPKDLPPAPLLDKEYD